ncbi:MAG: bifunctional oligoribonuclease/PAP phosphatase NrnA [Bacteroidia bacterium]|nr:bifunctional oligoribonuclease/PAP phosphatase NrnA [Bacteroidia bacterium]
MRRDNKKVITAAVKKCKTVTIVTHTNPDGDAMGSSLALYLLLKKLKKNVKVIVPNAFPQFLAWLPESKSVINFQKEEKKAKKFISQSDLLFVLDFNTLKRIDDLGEFIDGTTMPKFLIDHHQQPDKFAKYFYYDVKACSTCELIYDFMVELGQKKLLDKKIAACLYTGLMTDTGSFRFPSVTHKTHSIVAELLKTGMVPSDIHGAVYDTYSRDRMKLLGHALNTMHILPDNKTAYIALSKEVLEKYNYQKGDTEGMVNYPFSVNGIVFCAFFAEWDGYVKISFRSKGKIDVNKFAREHFSGGGHINAAGGKSHLSLQETVEKFVALRLK